MSGDHLAYLPQEQFFYRLVFSIHGSNAAFRYQVFFRLPHALLPRPSESLELVFTGVVHVVALGVPTLNVLHLGWLPGPSLASLAYVCDRSDFFSCVCTVYWSVCLSAADCPASFPSELVYYWTSSPPRTVGKNHASTVLPLRCGPRSRWTPPNRRGPCCFY